MTDPCSSCGVTPCAPHCAWATVAPVKSTVRASVDPGSRWIAVAITRDDGPASPCAYVEARVFHVPKVDHLVTYDPPEVRIKARRLIEGVPVEGPLETYEVREERLQSPDERLATDAARLRLGSEIGSYLVGHRVEAVAIEHVNDVFAPTAQAASAASKAIRIGEKIVERALTVWEMLSPPERLAAVPRSLMLATSWRARLSLLVKACNARLPVPREGVLIKSSDRGAALEPVLAEHVPGWPGGASFAADEIEHVRDAMGLALACGMPAPQGRKATTGAPRVRKPRAPGKAPPRRSRARAAMGPIDLEKHRATDRARYAKTVAPKLAAERQALLASRAAKHGAAGCTCRPPGVVTRGRHKFWCPAGV